MSDTTLDAVRKLSRILVDRAIVPVWKKGSAFNRRNYEYADEYELLCYLRGLSDSDPRVLYMNRRFGSAWKKQKSLKGESTLRVCF